MPSPFSAIEETVTRRSLAMLGNAEADFGGGVLISGIFNDPNAPQLGGLIERSDPEFESNSSDLAFVTYGAHVQIRGIQYVVGGIQPDGAGKTILALNEI